MMRRFDRLWFCWDVKLDVRLHLSQHACRVRQLLEGPARVVSLSRDIVEAVIGIGCASG